MPDNRGIEIKSTLGDLLKLVTDSEYTSGDYITGGDSWYGDIAVAFDDSAATYNWLIVSPEHLGGTSGSPALTPAETIQMLFGSSLSQRQSYDGGLSIGQEGISSGLVAPASEIESQMIDTFAASLATTYYGQAVMSNVPPQIESVTTDTIIGFFDHTTSFGLSYSWRIYFSTLDAQVSKTYTNMGGANPWEIAQEYDTTTSDVYNTALGTGQWFPVNELSEVGDYGDYPPHNGGGFPDSSFDRSAAKSWLGTGPPSWFPRGHTYVMEAMGMDYFDTVDYSGRGDASEMLVSDELYRSGPNETELDYTPDPQSDRYILNWWPSSEFISVMELRYHTKKTDDEGEYTDLGWVTAKQSSYEMSVEMGDSWTGSHEYEKQMRAFMINAECDKVYELYEVSELPKRFINKVQKRRDIPDGAVSAFGYIPPDGTTLSTTVSSYGLSPDTVREMGSDSTDGYDYGEEIIAGYGEGIGPWSYTATGATGAIPAGTEFTGLSAEEYWAHRAYDTGDCVIATHAVSSGMFSTEDKANAVDWCTNKLHGKWWGETMRRGYRYLGRKHIANGTAELVYDEFKECIEWANGRRPFELRIALRYAYRVAQTFIVGLFVKENE